MDNSISDQCIETSLEYMKFCSYVTDKEIQRFNLDFTTYQSFIAQLPGILDVNFDIAYNRCAFMYKYTLCNIYFFKDCMNRFILECPEEFKNLISKWTADTNIRLCSLSCGPGLDYLSFMMALFDHLTLPSFKSVTILSKHGAWRNTVSIVADALQQGVLSKCGIEKLVNFKNIEVVQTNVFISIPLKGLEALQNSSVILMVKSLNLTAPGTNEEIIRTKLLDLISSLKPESVIFFIDTKPSLTLFLEVLTYYDGKFLFKPEHLSFRVPVTFSEEYKEKYGCFPVVCSRGAFFVWQKLSSFNFNISTINPPTDVKDISQNFVEKLLNENEEVLNITKTFKDSILPNNIKSQFNSVDNVINGSYVNHNRESVSATSTLANTTKQLEKNKSASIQSLFTSQFVQRKTSPIHFDEKSCSSPALNKSSSIDNSFIQGSSLLSFLEESNLAKNYPLYTWINEETNPKRFSQQTSTDKEINKGNIVPDSNQALKPNSVSKGTQTDLNKLISDSSPTKDLTERVKKLVSSLENEVQKYIPDVGVNYNLNGMPSRGLNYSNCSTNSNNFDVNIKPTCSGYQTKGENPISYCSSTKINDVQCCAVNHNTIHRCEMHCCRSCIHKCHMHTYRPCENIVSCTSSAQPKIIIPLQNISEDMLMQIISAAKSDTKHK